MLRSWSEALAERPVSCAARTEVDGARALCNSICAGAAAA